jgi:hypothetical protein
MDSHHDMGFSRPKLMDKATHRGIAAGKAMILAKPLPQGHHLDALVEKLGDHRRERLDARRNAWGAGPHCQDLSQSRIVRQRGVWKQQSVLLRASPVPTDGGARNVQVLGDPALGLVAP